MGEERGKGRTGESRAEEEREGKGRERRESGGGERRRGKE